MLSCSCDFGDYDEWYDIPQDFSTFNLARRKRCWSCKELIDKKSQCVKFNKYRRTKSYIEERIYGDEKQLADWYLCECCGEKYLNLQALGYCILLGSDLQELLAEYWQENGFTPKGANVEKHKGNTQSC